MNSKMRNKVGNCKLKAGGVLFEEAKEEAEMMNKRFWKIFLEESERPTPKQNSEWPTPKQNSEWSTPKQNISNEVL